VSAPCAALCGSPPGIVYGAIATASFTGSDKPVTLHATDRLGNVRLNGYAAGMRVILVRHYQTQSNAEGRIIGWMDSPPCADWKDDIDFIDGRLREQGICFDAIYSSDLQRARETARVYAQSFDVAEITGKAELKEINYGELQTKTKTWAYEQYPEHKKNPDLVYPDGESFRQMQLRGVRSLSSLALSHPNDTILIVSHAGMIRGIVSHFLGLEYAPNLEQKVPFRYIGDFLFEGENFVRYDELGQPSGFVQDGVIEMPFSRARAVS
jgi:alpha-ribazole phosphatase